MALHIHCHACDLKLELREDMIGKTVRCPKCNAEFTAREELQGELVDEPAPPPSARKPARPELEDDEGYAKPRRRRRSEIEDDEEYEERPRRRRRRKRRADPKALVAAPAIALKAVALVGAALTIGSGVIRLGGELGARPTAYILGSLVGLAVTAIWSWFLFKAADSMGYLEGYGLAVAGCIVAMLPCSVGCLGGLPVGIWGLVVLCQKDVKDAFT